MFMRIECNFVIVHNSGKFFQKLKKQLVSEIKDQTSFLFQKRFYNSRESTLFPRVHDYSFCKGFFKKRKDLRHPE